MRAMIVGLLLGIVTAVFAPVIVGPSEPIAFAQGQQPSPGEGPGIVGNDLPKTGSGPRELDQPWALYVCAGAIVLLAIMLGYQQLRKSDGLTAPSAGGGHDRPKSHPNLSD